MVELLVIVLAPPRYFPWFVAAAVARDIPQAAGPDERGRESLGQPSAELNRRAKAACSVFV